MTLINVDSKVLFEDGLKNGSITQAAFDIVDRCPSGPINAALALDQDLLDSKRFEIMIILPDDSGSINDIRDESGKVMGPDAICEGQNLIIDSFLGSRKTHHEGVVVLTWPLNSTAPLQPLTSLLDPNITRLINGGNYKADGGTPLYDQTLMALATALAFKLLVKKEADAGCKGFIMVVSDGKDEGSTIFKARDVAVLVKELVGGNPDFPNISTAFMGIEGKNNSIDFRSIAHSMGIDDKYIFLTNSKSQNIRHTFGKMSQSAVGDIVITAP